MSRVEEPVERFLQSEFQFPDETDDLVNSCSVQRSSRLIDQQTNVLVKFDIGWQWQFHGFLESSAQINARRRQMGN
jgi:hypothetical protein